jgi:hypothetical protein
MKASKNVTAVVFAAALVGGIGLAYAQDDSGAQPRLSNGAQNSQPAIDNTVQNQAPVTPATTTDNPGFQTERPAQPDRN